METDFLVTGYSKLLHERSAQGEGEANHIASRLSNSFVPASEASCGRLYWGHSCRSWHALRTSVDRRDQWATYRVLDALFVARGNRGWRRRSSRCMASVRGTACSGDNLARGELTPVQLERRSPGGWSGQDFPQACANLPTAYRMRSRRHARVLFKSKPLVSR
jgi:hypothetical protein